MITGSDNDRPTYAASFLLTIIAVLTLLLSLSIASAQDTVEETTSETTPEATSGAADGTETETGAIQTTNEGDVPSAPTTDDATEVTVEVAAQPEPAPCLTATEVGALEPREFASAAVLERATPELRAHFQTVNGLLNRTRQWRKNALRAPVSAESSAKTEIGQNVVALARIQILQLRAFKGELTAEQEADLRSVNSNLEHFAYQLFEGSRYATSYFVAMALDNEAVMGLQSLGGLYFDAPEEPAKLTAISADANEAEKKKYATAKEAYDKDMVLYEASQKAFKRNRDGLSCYNRSQSEANRDKASTSNLTEAIRAFSKFMQREPQPRQKVKPDTQA